MGVQAVKPRVEFDFAEAREQAAARVDFRRVERLTAQELACLRLVAQRLSSKQIAAELGIAKTSVDTYCNRARQKLGVSDRYAAARLLAADWTGPAAAAAAAIVLPATVPTPRRVTVGAAAAGALAAALGVASLLAGMAALEELKPPNRARAAETAPPPAPVTVARDG